MIFGKSRIRKNVSFVNKQIGGRIMKTRFEGWPHIVEAQQFSREWIEGQFLPLADHMQEIFEQGGSDILGGKRMVSFFYEPSTRTRMSFERAMDCLGGRVMFSSDNAGEFSSASKGETLTDTIRVINRYRPDVIVLRYNQEIGAEFAAKVSRAPIISAGDRAPGQHPTQALLDLRTIFKRRGSIDGLRIAMAGDLLNGRTVRSLCYLLGKFKGIDITFVSPGTLQMKPDVKGYLNRHNVSFRELIDIGEAAETADVIYQTRTQTECGSDFNKSDRNLGRFIINWEVVGMMKEDAIIMHPLPRVDEITTDVDDNSRAVYLTDQIDSGLFTRMALLQMILDPHA